MSSKTQGLTIEKKGHKCLLIHTENRDGWHWKSFILRRPQLFASLFQLYRINFNLIHTIKTKPCEREVLHPFLSKLVFLNPPTCECWTCVHQFQVSSVFTTQNSPNLCSNTLITPNLYELGYVKQIRTQIQHTGTGIRIYEWRIIKICPTWNDTMNPRATSHVE